VRPRRRATYKKTLFHSWCYKLTRNPRVVWSKNCGSSRWVRCLEPSDEIRGRGRGDEASENCRWRRGNAVYTREAYLVELHADEVDAQGTKFLAGSWVVRAHYLEWADEELEHYRVDTTQAVTIYTRHARLANVEMTAVPCTRGGNTHFTLSDAEADRCLAIVVYL
jgi:hypothetical protein